MIDLVREVLDQLLVDAQDRYVGRVDGIILETRKNRPPKVAAVEISAATAARRVNRRFEAIVAAIARILHAEPVLLPLSTFKKIDVDIHLDLDSVRDRRLLQCEKWLSRTIIQKIPGGNRKDPAAHQ